VAGVIMRVIFKLDKVTKNNVRYSDGKYSTIYIAKDETSLGASFPETLIVTIEAPENVKA
jgi:hypothetical protein